MLTQPQDISGYDEKHKMDESHRLVVPQQGIIIDDHSRKYVTRIVQEADQVNSIEREPVLHWKSCCLDTDRQAVVYFGQLSFAFAVLAFSAAMLVNAKGDCDRSSPYIGLISFLLGKLLSSVTDSGHR